MIQFSDYQNTRLDLFNSLKTKIREPNHKKPEHVFALLDSNEIVYYKIEYDPNGQAQNVKHTKTFDAFKGTKNVVLFDNARAQAVCCLKSKKLIHIFDLVINKQVQHIETEDFIATMIWLKKKQYGQNFLVIGFKGGKVEIWDWNFKKCIDSCQTGIKIAYINEYTNGDLDAFEDDDDEKEGADVKCDFKKLEAYKENHVHGNLDYACFLNNSKTLVAYVEYNEDNDKIKIYNTQTNECSFEYDVFHYDFIGDLVYSFNHKLLISYGEGGTMDMRKLNISIDEKTVTIEYENLIPIIQIAGICSMQFINQEQTLLFGCAFNGSFFTVDLISKKVTHVSEKSWGSVGIVNALVV